MRTTRWRRSRNEREAGAPRPSGDRPADEPRSAGHDRRSPLNQATGTRELTEETDAPGSVRTARLTLPAVTSIATLGRGSARVFESDRIMFGADALTFREFMMSEPLPLATLHRSILEFLRGREDVVLFGAEAVNAYVPEPRMTQDLDLLCIDAEGVGRALCDDLRERFGIAVRIRRAGTGREFRIDQVRAEGNRHLVDLRRVDVLPEWETIAGVQVMAPAALIASKVIAYHKRRGQPKAGTDWRDLAMLLLTFPELKREASAVEDQLHAAGADRGTLAAWREIVAQDIRPAPDDEAW